jgi:hypothetical protein
MHNFTGDWGPSREAGQHELVCFPQAGGRRRPTSGQRISVQLPLGPRKRESFAGLINKSIYIGSSSCELFSEFLLLIPVKAQCDY